MIIETQYEIPTRYYSFLWLEWAYIRIDVFAVLDDCEPFLPLI